MSRAWPLSFMVRGNQYRPLRKYCFILLEFYYMFYQHQQPNYIAEFLSFSQHVQYIKTKKLAFISDFQGTYTDFFATYWSEISIRRWQTLNWSSNTDWPVCFLHTYSPILTSPIVRLVEVLHLPIFLKVLQALKTIMSAQNIAGLSSWHRIISVYLLGRIQKFVDLLLTRINVNRTD